MFKRIDHVEIVPKDLDKSIEFYTQILNFKLKERKKVAVPPLEEVVYLTLGDTMIELLSVKNPEPSAEGSWQVGCRMIALEVPDMEKAVQYLKSKGIEPSWGPVSLGPSKRAEIKDPSGLSIELRQW